MVEIGRVRVKTGNAPIEQKISAYPPQADICAFVSTSLETKRAAWRPSQGSGRPKCKREGVADDRFGSILLQKSFWGDERKFLEPLMRFTHGDVRDHIVSSKIDHGSPQWR